MQPTWLSADRRALALKLRGRDGGSGAPSPFTPVPRSAPLPLSGAQQRLWFLDRLAPGALLNNVAVGLRLRGACDATVLWPALNTIVSRHEVLRTRIAQMPDGALVGTVEPVTVPLPVIEADGRDAMTLARRLAREPLDLAGGPVLRATLLRSAPQDHLLVLVAHHAVADARSLEVLISELAVLCSPTGLGRDEPASQLPDLAVQYADYAAWQSRQLAGVPADRQVDWWRERLRGAEALDLPTDRPRPHRWSFAGADLETVIPVHMATALHTLARAHHATRFMAAIAAVAILLSRLSGRSDIVLGTTVDGRDRAELHPLVGCFVNLVPIRIDLSGAPGFGTMLDRVRAEVLDVLTNAELPFETLVQRLRVAREPGGRVPLVRHVVQYADQFTAQPLGMADAEIVAVPADTARFDLTFFLTGRPDGSLACRVVYSTELYGRSTVDQMLVVLRTVYRVALEDLSIGVVDVA
jgi:hypothetical protein